MAGLDLNAVDFLIDVLWRISGLTIEVWRIMLSLNILDYI